MKGSTIVLLMILVAAAVAAGAAVYFFVLDKEDKDGGDADKKMADGGDKKMDGGGDKKMDGEGDADDKGDGGVETTVDYDYGDTEGGYPVTDEDYIDGFGLVFPFQWKTCGRRSPKPKRYGGAAGDWEEEDRKAGGRVIGDKSYYAREGQFPFFLALVALNYQGPSRSTGFFYCGAGLLAGRWGVTAAHCCDHYYRINMGPKYDLKDLLVAAGGPAMRESEAVDWHLTEKRPRPYVTTMTGCARHPEYNQTSLQNDIAVVTWEDEYVQTRITLAADEVSGEAERQLIVINSICVPPPFSLSVFEGDLWLAGVGIGYLDEPIGLRYGSFHVTNGTDECQTEFPGQYSSCRTPPSDENAACAGDSGSPLGDRGVRDGASNRFRMVALVSQGMTGTVTLEDGTTYRNCTNTYRNLFTDVSFYIEFITNTIGEN